MRDFAFPTLHPDGIVVGASSIYGGSWMEGSGAVFAENQALRWIADLQTQHGFLQAPDESIVDCTMHDRP